MPKPIELIWTEKATVKALPAKLVHSQTCGDEPTENMLIHGDNLSVLSSLVRTYSGMMNCIYIDPPYNTGTQRGRRKC